MIGKMMEPIDIADWEALADHLSKFTRLCSPTVPPLITITLHAPVDVDGRRFEAGTYYHPHRVLNG